MDSGGGRPPSQIRVVIVDDQQMFVDALRSLLEVEADIEVVAAANDPHTMQDIAADADVVLMDIARPSSDGLELTRAVRAARPAQQVIVISGRSDDGVEADALAAGAAAFLLKGGLDGEVAGTIRRVTTRRQQ
jgi:DNA-binding NarL/FixJ family response regulator